jgi:hypothetical protein
LIPKFQDRVISDLDEVFFRGKDKEVFNTKHNINGEVLDVIVDNDTLEERARSRSSGQFETLFQSEILFFIKKELLGYMPRVDDSMQFDEQEYAITNVNDDFGLLEITLSGNLSR